MSALKKGVLFLGDVGALYAALAFTLLIRYGSDFFGDAFRTHLAPFSVIFLLWLLILYLADLYRLASLRSVTATAATLAIAATVAGVLSVVCFYLFTNFFALTPKTNLLIFVAVFFLIDIAWRALTRKWFAAAAENVIVIGASPRTRELVAFLEENPHAGYRVAVWIENESSSELRNLTEIARDAHATAVVVPTAASGANADILSAVYQLLPLELAIVSTADFYELIFERTPLDEVGESWFIENISTRRPFYDPLKRVVDLALGSLLFVVFLPFMLVIGLAVATTSPGPVIFPQKRCGKNGKPFTLYKFRIMVANHDGSPWTVKNDPRFTRVGRFLNFTHLNELPQIVNVVKGDLSFTGPRPESLELAAQYAKLPYYEMRHVVKPGITGWAQINFQPSTSLEEASVKLTYDIYYVKNRSIFLDLMIILRTVRYFFLSH
jgi:exopolysaccharide biosynthesis polyprenyl glycosylphosphotransferase